MMSSRTPSSLTCLLTGIIAAGLLTAGMATSVASAATIPNSGSPVQVDVKGLVLSTAGKPIAGAEVRFGSTSVTTDSAGRYLVAIGAALRLSGAVWAPGYAQKSFTFRLTSIPTSNDTIRLASFHLQSLFDNPTYGATLRGLLSVMTGSARTVTVHGKSRVALDPLLYVTQPSGNVNTYRLRLSGRAFEAKIPFREKGIYQVEINTSEGLPAFNVPVYDGVTPTMLTGPAFPANPVDHSQKTLQRFTLKLVNEIRSQAGLAKLAASGRLDRSALGHSEDAARHGYFFSHPHIGSNGSTPGQRMAAAGAHCTLWGENVGLGPSIGNVMDGFDLSPSHRSLLVGRYTSAGAGVSVWDGQYLVTIDLCKPAKKGK